MSTTREEFLIMASLFDPIDVGKLTLSNRIVMAPLTRNSGPATGRCAGHRGRVLPPTRRRRPDHHRGHAAQRRRPGLTSTLPACTTDDQREGWSRVADRGARGRRAPVRPADARRTQSVTHPDNNGPAPQTGGTERDRSAGTDRQPRPDSRTTHTPRALDTAEISGVVADYVHAAQQAIAAGLDGVEIHGANGYLVHQFLAPSSNHREDEYGGTPANRARFAIEVVAAVAQAIGPERVGIRISPAHNIQGVIEDDEQDTTSTYRALVDGIRGLGLAYLSYLADPRAELTRDLRARFAGPVIGNSGFGQVTTKESAQQLLDEDLADLVAVGRPVLANPDLVERWRTGAELNEPDQKTFYGGGAEGYTDYAYLA